MAKEVPWDDQTDAFLSDLSPAITKKYGINLRTLLTNPKSYEDKKDMPTTIKKIRADVDDYFAALLSELKDKQKDLDEELGELTDQSKQIRSIIASKSTVARVPFVKPMYVDSNPDNQETIVIEKYDSSLNSFIGKLVNGSNYVADMSTEYKNHTLGSWLFSGAKNYILTINTPPNPILTIENSRALIENTLDALSGG